MFSVKILLNILVIIVGIQNGNALRPFEIRWKTANCTVMSKAYMSFFNCSITEYPRNRGNAVTIHMQFSQNIEKVRLEFRVTMPSDRNKEMDLVKFSADGCNMSKHRSSNPIVTSLSKQLLQTGNFSNDCPLLGNVTYTMANLSLNPDYFPGYTPEVSFSFKLSMFTGKIHLLAATAVARVMKRK